LNRIEQDVFCYNKNVLIASFLKEELKKRGLSYLAGELKIYNVKDEECEPDLLFLCNKNFGILFEVKSSLPDEKDIEDKDGKIYNKFVKTLIRKKKYFEKMKDFPKHEVIFVIHGDDLYKFVKLVFSPDNREELKFFLKEEFNFQLWIHDIGKRKKNREKTEGLRISPAIGKSNCNKLDVEDFLSDSQNLTQLKVQKRFIRTKPPVEYTMQYILFKIPSLIEKEIENNPTQNISEMQWKTAEEIHQLILGEGVGLEKHLPLKQWIKEALSLLVNIYMIEKKGDKFYIPKKRYHEETFYEIFAEKEVELSHGILRKRGISRKRRKKVEGIYIPNSTYNMISSIIKSTYEEGGVIDKEDLKKKRGSRDIHQEKNSAIYLGFVEEHEGKIMITNIGIEFVKSEEYGRRMIFHSQALEKVPLYRLRKKVR